VLFDDAKGGKPNWHQGRWGQYKKQIGWLVGIERVISIPVAPE
jgi:hypothetical protein